MAAIANFYIAETANQARTGSTAYATVSTNTQIATANFVAGQKYLLLVACQTSRSVSSGNGKLRVVHGSTAFADSEYSFQPNLSDTRLSYFYFTVWTAVADEAILLQHGTHETTNTTNTDQAVLFAMRLDDGLTENTDWFYNENTVSNALSQTFEAGASVTFTPAAADNVWLLLNRLQATESATTSEGESRAALSGGTTANWGLWSVEGEDLTLDIAFYSFLRAISLPATEHTFTVQGRSEASNVFTHLRSAVFCVNLSKFTDVTQVFTATASAYSNSAWADLVQTTTHTVTAAGNVLVLGSNIDDTLATTNSTRHRFQIGNVDAPASQTSDAYAMSGPNNDSSDQSGFNFFVQTSLASSVAIDHDGYASTTGLTFADRSLVAFSMDLAAGGFTGTGSMSLAPTLAAVGTLLLTGAGAMSLAPTMAAQGTVINPISGQAAMTLAPTLAGTGQVQYTGTGSLLVTPTLTGTGTLGYPSTGAVSLALSMEGTGTVTEGSGIAGSGALTISLTLAATGQVTHEGTGSLTLAPTMAGEGTSTLAITGTGELTLAPTLDASGTVTEPEAPVGTISRGGAWSGRHRGPRTRFGVSEWESQREEQEATVAVPEPPIAPAPPPAPALPRYKSLGITPPEIPVVAAPPPAPVESAWVRPEVSDDDEAWYLIHLLSGDV